MRDAAWALACIQADICLLKWMVGFNVAVSIAMFGLLLRFAA